MDVTLFCHGYSGLEEIKNFSRNKVEKYAIYVLNIDQSEKLSVLNIR